MTLFNIVGGCLYDEVGRVLIIKRSFRSKIEAGKWEIPKGKVRRGEDPKNALVREMREEIGIKAEIRESLLQRSFSILGIRISLQVFLIETKVSPVIEISSEHSDFAWVDRETIGAYEFSISMNSVVQELLEKYPVI
ncbi:RNA pyrophosphohydrolase [subsurface metagenome]